MKNCDQCNELKDEICDDCGMTICDECYMEYHFDPEFPRGSDKLYLCSECFKKRVE
jgi:hypothetical protein